MRVLTWNVKTGGSGGRLDGILAVLRRARPDLLALQELRGFDKDGQTLMRRVAAGLGMEAQLSRSVFGQPVAVLVRPPLRIVRRDAVRWRLHHAAAAATIATAAGPLTFVSTHLNPFAPYRRMREATWLAARYRTPLTLLAGDLNGLSPLEDHTASLATLDARYRRRHLAADGTADTRGLAAFEAGGLHDRWPAVGVGDGRTVPTSAGSGAEFGPMRLDYLLASPGLAGHVRELRVVRGDETEWASDHYPLSAELTI